MFQFGRLKTLEWLFIINFIAALSAYLMIYINSNFLNELIDEQMIGIAYSTAALLTIVFLVYLPKILRFVGAYTSVVFLMTLQIGLFLGLAFVPYEPILLAIFLLYAIVHVGIVYHFDIFIEHYSARTDIGEIRGKFLTITSVAVLLSPLLVGLILGQTEAYWKIYLLGAILLSPATLLLASHLHNFKDPEYSAVNFIYSFRCMLDNKNIVNIFLSHFILRIFFTWMVIYMPLYLHEHIGLPWSDIGIIFTIMLIPYVLLEIPLGRFADDVLGEKELLVAGFIILGLSTLIIPFMDTTSIIAWAAVLFVTRIGASAIEVMTESYFFKQVDDGDTNTLSIFRMTRPLSTLVGPLLATAALFFMPLQFTFLIVGFLSLYGVHYALQIRDTR